MSFGLTSKRLDQVLPMVAGIYSWSNMALTGVTADSRQVEPGNLYLACTSNTQQLRQYIMQAQQNHAAAIAVDVDQMAALDLAGFSLPLIPYPALAKQQGAIGAAYYDYPSEQLELIGITGTNGKTSCSHFIAQCFTRFKQPCGVIGTLGYGVLDNLQPAINTTPDAVTINRHLAVMLSQQARYVAMEVSSHGLQQNRLDGLRFSTAVFTNLTRDHLDYHGTMQAYAEVKSQLLRWPSLKTAVINYDDDFGRGLINSVAPSVQLLTYSALVRESAHVEIGLTHLQLDLEGLVMALVTPWGKAELKVRVLGRFNVSNLLATLAVLLSQGLSLDAAVKVLEHVHPVTGRMQLLGISGQPRVLVDYAHTPDALRQALRAAREHIPSGRLLCLFGCGGDRDKGKRPQMARIAEQLANQVWVTDDNPRTEDSAAIIADIRTGFIRPKEVNYEPDRNQAIHQAIAEAGTGDLVMVVGKGHETWQEVNQQRHHFSDQEQVEAALTCWEKSA